MVLHITGKGKTSKLIASFDRILWILFSLFASESCLQFFLNMPMERSLLVNKISFWWSVFSQIHSTRVQYNPKLLTDEKLMEDTFLDWNIQSNYRQEFELIYRQVFGELPDTSIKFYSRYQRGLLVFHSMMYSRGEQCCSYNVCVKINGNETSSCLRYGQILFFFYVKNEPFLFLNRFNNSKNKFSFLLKPMEEIPNWSMYLDKYYPIIRRSLPSLVIYPCSFIMYKCIFFPLDDEFFVCTPVELEMEHD